MAAIAGATSPGGRPLRVGRFCRWRLIGAHKLVGALVFGEVEARAGGIGGRDSRLRSRGVALRGSASLTQNVGYL